LREITEQYAGDWEQTYEDALAESEMTEEDETYLQSEVKEAGGLAVRPAQLTKTVGSCSR
jgi:hypothetical protein